MKRSILLLPLLSVALCASAQMPAPATQRTPYYLDLSRLDFVALLPLPPAIGTPASRADFATLHRLQSTRTRAQIAAAQYDATVEEMFFYASILGPDYKPANLPLTAALFAHIHNEAAIVNGDIKPHYMRPRPFTTDPTLHPVCGRPTDTSYPSGHATLGYLLGFALTQLIPEKSAAILTRADQFAFNREVCGAHFPSDVEGGHQSALAIFGAISASPKFQHDLAAARKELRQQLHLPTTN